MSLKPVLPGNLVQVPAATSAAAIPGLPIWTFAAADSSTPATGNFTTNNTAYGSTTALFLSTTTKSGFNLNSLLDSFLDDVYFILTSLSTGISTLLYTSGAGVTDGTTIVFNPISVPGDMAASGNWFGDYAVSFVSFHIPPVPTISIVLAQTGTVPFPDGTYAISSTLGGSVTIASGVITNWTSAS